MIAGLGFAAPSAALDSPAAPDSVVSAPAPAMQDSAATLPVTPALPDSQSSARGDASRMLAEDRDFDAWKPDTIEFHARVGTSADATNETYFQDAFVDTTFLGRQLADTPERRYAGILSAVFAGTRNQQATHYALQTEASIGTQLEREFATLSWRSTLSPEWTWSFDPSAEHRRDRTFDRDLEEWRATLATRVRRLLADDLASAELGGRADLLRASGQGSEFQPDRDALSLWTGLDHFGLSGDEWRLGYRLTARTFPDSANRDHFEHQWDAHGKAVFRGGRWLALDVTATRRVTARVVPTTRDNFWIGDALLEGRVDLNPRWGIDARAEGEGTRYDLEDSTLYFDYQIARFQVGARYEPRVQWVVELGPRLESLFARLNPGEQYQEWSGYLNVEFLGRGPWWNVTPAAGWREYQEITSAGPGTPPIHSSFAFVALDLIADQQLPGQLRFRAVTSLRWEYHVDPVQDASSLYASLELSRGLW